MERRDHILRVQFLVASLLLIAVPVTLASQSSQINMPRGITLEDGQQFDYIVVGAGAAGSAAAARLALAGFSVALVEAGGDPGPVSWVPALALSLLSTDIDWYYQTITNNQSCLAFRGNQCRYSRGKCLGGTTALNFMIYVRGNPYDWDSLGIPGWTWEDMRPYFLRYEGLKDLNLLPNSSKPYHNTHGIMELEFFGDDNNPWHSRLVEGFLMLDFPNNPDVNAVSQIGVTQVVGYVNDGERMSTARGYLGRSDVQEKLKVAKQTRCIKVIIDDDQIARGITVVSGDDKLNIYATREVILSAGALATPQILMLSGIGHADHLNSLNIPVHADLPVGDEMTDHLSPFIFVKVDGDSRLAKILWSAMDGMDSVFQFLESRDGPLASIGISDISTFVNTLCYDYKRRQLRNNSHGHDCQLPTTQFIHAYLPQGAVTLSAFFQQATNFKDDAIKQLADVSANNAFIVFAPIVLQPKSLGHVRLASSNPLDSPAIFPNLLSDKRDVEEMLRAIRIIEDVVETRPFKKHKASIVKLRFKDCPSIEDAEYWECYVRHVVQTTFHSVGTTGIGRVVDETLKVFGVKGLRVADQGVLPKMVRGNTAASTIAVGERVVDFLIKDSVN